MTDLATRWLPRTLRAQVISVVLLGVIPLFGLALVLAYEAQTRETARTEHDAVVLARVIGLEERRLFDQTQVLLIDLSHRSDVTDPGAPGCAAALAHTLEHFERYDNLAVIDADGTMVCSAVPPPGPINVADRDYFRRALDTAGFVFGGYQLERVTRRPAIVFAFPIENRSGGVSGLVTAAMDLARLSTLEEAVADLLPDGSSVAKVDRDGRIIALAPYDPTRIGTSHFGLEDLQPLLTRPSGVVSATDNRGVTHLLAAAHAPFSLQGGSITVVLRLPEDAAYAEIDRQLRRALLVLVIVTALVIAATWLATSYLIDRPLQRLIAATGRVAGGEFDLRLRSLYDSGDVGRLAQSLDEMAEALQAREQTIGEARDRLRALSGRLLQIQETERRSIAHVLHDDIGQVLSALGQDLQAALLSEDMDSARQVLRESLRTVKQALDRARELSVEMRPAILDDLGLGPAARWLVNRQAHRSGFVPTVRVDLPERLPTVIETTCFRILQEALTNVTKHADAARVRIEIRGSDGLVTLDVVDDGRGFDLEATQRRGVGHESFGLAAMQERVELLRGRLRIESSPGQGTSVHVQLPVTEG